MAKAFMLVAVTAVAALAAWKFAARRNAPIATAEPVAVALPSNAVEIAAVDVPRTSPATNAASRAFSSFAGKGVVRPKSVPTEKGGKVEVGQVVYGTAVGTYVSETNVISHTPRLFKSRTEEFLVRYARSFRRPAMIFAKIDDDLEKDCMECLRNDVVIYDDDTEETVAIKEAVAALKADMAKALEEGYSAKDILNEMSSANNENVRQRFKMQRTLNEMLKAGDAEMAKAYFSQANEQLDYCGFPHLNFDEKLIGTGQVETPANGETN